MSRISITPPKFLPDLLLAKPPRLPPQHLSQLNLTHPNLLPHRHQLLRQMQVVLRQQAKRNLEVVDILKDQGSFLGVACFGFQEGVWVVSPVAEWVKVVRGVVAVVEAETVGLVDSLAG